MTTLPEGMFTSLTGMTAAVPPEPLAVPLSGVPGLPPSWLWPGVIPGRAPVLLVGPAGTGKGLTLAAITALVTTGQSFPGEAGDVTREPRQVIMVAPEDDVNEDLVFRLRAAGADLSLVRLLNWLPDSSRFTLPGSLEVLRDAIVEASAAGPPVGLVILDPLLAMCERSIASATAARAVIEPLQDISRELGVAMIISHHTTKDARVVAGSKALTDAARMVWGLSVASGDLLVMRVLKSNKEHAGPVYLLIDRDGDGTRVVFLESEASTPAPGSRASKLRLGEREEEKGTAA